MKNKEIVFCAVGTKGDIFPLLDMARIFLKRDYAVHFLANDYFRDFLAGEEIIFHSIGSKIDYIRFHGDKNLWKINSDALEIGFEYYFRPQISLSYEITKNLIRKNSEIIVVTTISGSSGSRIAADQFDAWSVLINLSPACIPSISSPHAPLCWVKPRIIPGFIFSGFLRLLRVFRFLYPEKKYINEIDNIRGDAGLKSIKNLKSSDQKNTLVQIGLFPEWFAMRPKDWPKKLKLVGFPLHNSKNPEEIRLVDEFINENGAPLIFTSGTGVKDTYDIFSVGLDVCKMMNLPGIFVGGIDGKNLFKCVKSCLHIDYVDFEYVLQRAKAIVHHGGIGTVAQAIHSGIPQLVRPLAFDQHDNANRLHNLGLGTFIMPDNFNPENVSRVLDAMIHSKEQDKNIKMYAANVSRCNALDKACDLIEEKWMEVSGVGEKNYVLD